jgi:hypothetical protein
VVTSGPDCAGKIDRAIFNPLLHRPCDAVLRVPQGLGRHFRRGRQGALASCAFPTDGGRRCCERCARIAVSEPVNGSVEIAGPEQFRVDELVRRCLASLKDPREVIADPKALYSGAKLSEVPDQGLFKFQQLPVNARGRGFESRRPRHSFSNTEPHTCFPRILASKGLQL